MEARIEMNIYQKKKKHPKQNHFLYLFLPKQILFQ